jgi:acetyl-CoA synthetase
VVKEIGALARPDDLRFTDALPKTRSGKIMRRVLAAISNNMDTGDITTLANPDIVAQIRELVQGRNAVPLKEGPADIKLFGEEA